MGCVTKGAELIEVQSAADVDRRMAAERAVQAQADQMAKAEDDLLRNKMGSGGGGGGNNNGGSGGGNNGNGGMPPRTNEAAGYYYDDEHYKQVTGGRRGVTPEQVASLPRTSIWEADSVDRLRGELAVVYFDGRNSNHYTAYNEDRSEVVQMADRTDPDWVPDRDIGPRRTGFARIARFLFHREKEYHPPFINTLDAQGPVRKTHIAGVYRHHMLG